MGGELIASASGLLRTQEKKIVQSITEKPLFCNIKKRPVKGSGHSLKRVFKRASLQREKMSFKEQIVHTPIMVINTQMWGLMLLKVKQLLD